MSALPAIDLGGFRVTLVREDIYWWDGGAMFGVVPKTLWSRKSPPDHLNRLPLGFNCYIVETGEHTILLDTGGGGGHRSRAHRHRRQQPPSLGPLRLEYDSDPGRPASRVPPRHLLYAARRV